MVTERFPIGDKRCQYCSSPLQAEV
jgi:hypothetical protein